MLVPDSLRDAAACVKAVTPPPLDSPPPSLGVAGTLLDGTLAQPYLTGGYLAESGRSGKVLRAAALGALLCTPALLRLLGIPILPARWLLWSRRLTNRMDRMYHAVLNASFKASGRYVPITLHTIVAALASLGGPASLIARSLGKGLLWRALLHPHSWPFNRKPERKDPPADARPSESSEDCYTLLGASVMDSPTLRTQHGQHGSTSRPGSEEDEEGDCISAMLQFASIGCGEEDCSKPWSWSQDAEQTGGTLWG